MESESVRTCPECGQTKPEKDFWHLARRCRSCVARESASNRSYRAATWKTSVQARHKVKVAPSKKRYVKMEAAARSSAESEIPETAGNKLGYFFGCSGPIAIVIGLFLFLGKRSNQDEGLTTMAVGATALVLCVLLTRERNAAVNKLQASKLDSSVVQHEQFQLEYDEFYRTPEWRQLRRLVIHRDGTTCRSCGKVILDAFDLTIDHIKPRSKHPHLALEISNLRVTCRPCNSSKGARDIE
jgi:hypothetical protein